MSNKPLVLFIRHAHSVANTMSLSELATTGVEIQDFPLTDIGRTQAGFTAAHIDKCYGRIDRIISSNYLRAVQTALILFPWRQIQLDPRLGEVHYGIWTSMTTEEITVKFPNELRRYRNDRPYYFQPTGGESWGTAEVRLRQIINELMRFTSGITAIVSHGHVFNLFQRLVEHLTIEEIEQRFRDHQYVRNASVTAYEHTADGQLARIGETETPWLGKI